KKYSANNEINCIILGEGITSRYFKRHLAPKKLIKEIQKKSKIVAKKIGIKELKQYQLPDNRFDSVDFLDIVKQIENDLLKIKPEIIFTHSNSDLNIDHQITFQAVLTATRPILNSTVKEIYSFEIPSSTDWSFGKINGVFTPNLFIDISETFNEKLEALKIYDSEIRTFPHPRSDEALISIAKRWGATAGLQFAEAFEIIRIIR
ncbi:MAG TPA: PIG-L family deacetylase, partial [bacterium]|nr:PIG-L family deacetylase [bacterium]